MESSPYHPNYSTNEMDAPVIGGILPPIPAQQVDKMNCSMNSTLEDTTPSDSGVQLLDSEESASEVMIESITSQMGFDFETESTALRGNGYGGVGGAPPPIVDEVLPIFRDTNSNVTNVEQVKPILNANEDTMTSSACSTFDTTEQIVYRRRARKPPQNNGAVGGNSTGGGKTAPKKRVSFHEDILKSTRTDNIHIEHGFITYKMGNAGRRGGGGYSHNRTATSAGGGRYSWCPEGDRGATNNGKTMELCAFHDDEQDGGSENNPDGNGRRTGARYNALYRNACSDVLDYGNSDVYDTHHDEPSQNLRYVNSGVFEYNQAQQQQQQLQKTQQDATENNGAEKTVLYRCSCSSSNSSLDSDAETEGAGAARGDKNSNQHQQRQQKQQYGQAKSSSCDCIGMSQNVANNNHLIGDNCYFSEPSIEQLPPGRVKSVWNKEQRPKTSCLKKTGLHTYIIQEHDLNTKMKKFNVHDMNQLLDNSSKMLIGSLKSIFTMPMPERGVPEGSEDLQAVAECVPEAEATPEHHSNLKPNNFAQQLPRHNTESSEEHSPLSPLSPTQLKQKPFLSKSLDGSKKAQHFVHNVDDQLRRKNNMQLFAPTRQSSAENCGGSSGNNSANISPIENDNQIESNNTRSLCRQDEIEFDTDVQISSLQAINQHSVQQSNVQILSPPSEASSSLSASSAQQPQQFRNKFIINCESTVFEHTGVSYETNMAFANNSASHAADESDSAQAGQHFDDDDDDDDDDNNTEAKSPPNAFNESGSGGNASNIMPGHFLEKTTPIAQPEQPRGFMSAAPIARHFTNFFRSFKEPSPPPPAPAVIRNQSMKKSPGTSPTVSQSSSSSQPQRTMQKLIDVPPKSSTSLARGNGGIVPSNSLAIGGDMRSQLERQTRHLPSPLKKRFGGGGGGATPSSGPMQQARQNNSTMLSPDLFNGYHATRGGCGRDSKSTILSDELDDILTITTDMDSDRNDNTDIVIVDYSEVAGAVNQEAYHSTPTTTTTTSNNNWLKPPQSAKSSLINRFLRHATQKKLLEASIRRNDFFANKMKNEQRLYVRGIRPQNYELIDDLNAEIAMEIEMSGGANSPRRELTDLGNTEIGRSRERCVSNNVCVDSRRDMSDIDDDNDDDDDDENGGNNDDEDDMLMLPGDVARFELGIGEIAVDIFKRNGNNGRLSMFRNQNEQLLKIFKLYTGYSRIGHMTPVLVFLTDHTLYVCDLVRSRLCTKFVLPYVDLDVILMGPFGNTVLLSNSERDMQQVLLAGGPYPAAGLVANLEMCARRSGSKLPAVGQLTLAHLSPLQAFVRANSCVDKTDLWLYYAVINVPAGGVLQSGPISVGSNGIAIGNIDGTEQEPLGPHVKGFLMHRRIIDQGQKSVTNDSKIGWNPGYFLLKAGVLYMFGDSTQKLPSWAMALAECQGARRAVRIGRPHCFEILLRGGEALQLAAPDEYVASEWLQALLQSASGLFEMQEKHKTLGCTLIVTQHHLITLREDFTAPLRRQLLNNNHNKQQRQNDQTDNANGGTDTVAGTPQSTAGGCIINDSPIIGLSGDCGSLVSSTVSTPTRCYAHNSQISSRCSTPTRLSSTRSSVTARGVNDTASNSMSTNTASTTNTNTTSQRLRYENHHHHHHLGDGEEESFSHMSSVYGKNSGVEILTCADIKHMIGIKIPSHNDTWWCVLEFSCQEVRALSDDLVIFFASSSEMQRFLRLLEQLWQAKNNDLFPITILDEDDPLAEQCTMLYMDINRSWEPLLSAALGYPL